MVIIVLGLPGSGKSYFAEHLAKSLYAVYLSSDKIREEMGKRGAYSKEDKTAVYDEILKKMQEGLNKKQPVVLDATFYKKSLRDRFYQEAVKKDSEVFFIKVWAEEAIVKERTSRKRQDSDADFSIYLKIKKEFDPIEYPHLNLESTNHNIKEMLQQALSFLNPKNNGSRNHSTTL